MTSWQKWFERGFSVCLLGQILRYAIVGISSNAILYGLYLALTWLGIGHMVAMTFAYSVGVCQTFFVNRAWTFNSKVRKGPAFRRYVATYALGYVVQAGLLYTLVDLLGWRHEYVQGALIFFVAGLIFVLQRVWVFPDHDPRASLSRAPVA